MKRRILIPAWIALRRIGGSSHGETADLRFAEGQLWLAKQSAGEVGIPCKVGRKLPLGNFSGNCCSSSSNCRFVADDAIFAYTGRTMDWR